VNRGATADAPLVHSGAALTARQAAPSIGVVLFLVAGCCSRGDIVAYIGPASLDCIEQHSSAGRGQHRALAVVK